MARSYKTVHYIIYFPFRIGKLITIEIIYNYKEHEWKTTIIMCWKLSITIL